MAPITIYGCPESACARAVTMTAQNLKIDYTVKLVDLFAGEHKKDWYKAINPEMLVPVIDDDGFRMPESRAISQYLVNSRAPASSLYPLDAKKRAVVDQRLYYDACIFFPRVDALWQHVFNGGSEITEHIRKQLLDAVSHINRFLTGNKWIAGDDLTIADFHTIALMAEMYLLEFPCEKYPEVERWWEQCKEVVIGFQLNYDCAKQGTDFLNSKLTGMKF